MPKKSAGLLVYRHSANQSGLEVLLVHPGGPFWRNKDQGAWTIPKGEFDDDEDPLAAAKREFKEETGSPSPSGQPIQLTPIRQKGGKVVHAWAIEGDFDPATLKSNWFEMEWPPRSGKVERFPEIDRAEWFTTEVATGKILQGQQELLGELLRIVALPSGSNAGISR
jgi:predicted NUDIX family NTP pyrophosphohydrolase